MGERLAVVVPAYNEAKTIGMTVMAVLRDQTAKPDALIIVNNSSSDSTAEIVQDLKARYPLLHLLSEPRKGTGAACRTGFRYAIDEVGATIVARTDADTVPRPSWCAEIIRYFAKHPNKVTLAGISAALKDEFYKPSDFYNMPVTTALYRILNAIKARSAEPLTATFGHNMAVRGKAYDAAGEFQPTSIEQFDEDLMLFRELYRLYGRRATGFSPRMVVHTSSRRIRKLDHGYGGAALYYDNQLDMDPEQRARRRLEATNGEIDVR